MDLLAGATASSIVPIAGVGLAVIALWSVLVALRSPLLVRLGLRNVPRRPARAVLIVVGLMLSTTVISSAVATGDAMTWTVRSVVTESLGTVDEVVVLDRPRRRVDDRLRALTEPGLGSIAAARPAFFSVAEASRLATETAGDPAIAAVAPAIVDRVTVVVADSRTTKADVLVVAIPSPLDDVFGGLEGINGSVVDLDTLAKDDILVNDAAAAELAAATGSRLELLPNDINWGGLETGEAWTVRVDSVVRDTGFAGRQPVIVVPLARYQAALRRDGQVNVVLVANRGGIASVENTERALEMLRVELVDRAAAERLHAMLSTPDALQGLVDAAATLEDGDRERVSALREEAERPRMSDRFISLVSDPRVRAGLYHLAGDHLRGAERAEAFRLLRNVTTLSVLPVKQQGVDQADEYGTVVTTVFLVLGIFSIGASVLLIVLTFSLLAADRGSELATLRALGMTSRQVTTIFLAEGLLYALGGALLGVLAGLAAARLTVASLARALDPFGFQLRQHTEPRSLAVAFAAGVVLTFAVMCLAAWRVSRVNIVSATHGELHEQRRTWWAGAGLLSLGAAWLVWTGWSDTAATFEPRHSLVLPVTRTLALAGCFALGRWMLGVTRSGGHVLTAVFPCALAAVWLATLRALPTPRGSTTADATTTAVGGLVLLVCVTWAVARAGEPLLRLVDRALSRAARLRSIVRPAAGQLGWQRWRSGLTVTMFAMVIFIMAASLTLIDALLDAYAANEAPVAGFELRAEYRSAGNPPAASDALARSDAIATSAFDAVGSTSRLDVQVVQIGVQRASWRGASLVAADDGFLGAARVRMQRRVSGYADAAAIWKALREQPGTAVVSASLLTSVVEVDRDAGEHAMPPLTIWVRQSTSTTSRPARLRVIGVIDSRSDLTPALYTSRDTAGAMNVPLPPADTWFLSLAPGTDIDDAAEGLRVALSGQGVVVTDLGDSLRIGQSIRTLLTRVVQGFMGLGLIAGVAALGLLGVQSVIERRQQLGTLRALGFTRGDASATLALESTFVALAGITLGIALGLFLARALIELLAVRHPEIGFSIPWSQIGITTALAWCGSSLSITLAARQAGRVAPADALRVA